MKRKNQYIQKFGRKPGFCHVKTLEEIYHWNTVEGAQVERNKKLSNFHEMFGTKACAFYDLVGKGEYIKLTYVLKSEIVKFAIRKGLYSSNLWQCSGCLTFWYGSGSGTTDPYHWITDPDHALLLSGQQDDDNQKSSWFRVFSLITYCGQIYTSP